MGFELLDETLKDTMLRHADQTNPQDKRIKLSKGPPWAAGSGSPKAYAAHYWRYSLACQDGLVRARPLHFNKAALDAETDTASTCSHKHIEIGTVEWKDLKIRLDKAHQSTIPLPLDDEFLLGHYELEKGFIPESESHHLWRVEFKVDRSVELVYGYGIHTAEGENAKPQPLQLEFKGQTGEQVIQEVCDLSVLVCISLVVCEPSAKVEPAEILLSGKFFPLIMAKVTKPIAEFEGSVVVDRPKITSMPSDYIDPDGYMSGELFTDNNDIVVNTTKGHFSEEINIEVRSYWGLAPTWPEAFAYYLIEPPPKKKYRLVRREKAGETRQQIGGVKRMIPALLDVAQLIPPIPPGPPLKSKGITSFAPVFNPPAVIKPGAGLLGKAFFPIERSGRKLLTLASLAWVASKGIVDLWDRYKEGIVHKEPRQGEFDNVHLAPRFRYIRSQTEVDWMQLWLRCTGSHWAIERKGGEYLVPMAPLCHCDCLHTHWRWSTVADVMHNRGWNGWGQPASKSGAAMIPPNQELSMEMIGDVDGATQRAYTTGFVYTANAQPVEPEHFQVIFHHGTGISLQIVPVHFVKNLLSRQVGPAASKFLAGLLAAGRTLSDPCLSFDRQYRFALQEMQQKFDDLEARLKDADEYTIWPRAYFYQRYTVSSGEERMVFRGGPAGLKRLCMGGDDPRLRLVSAQIKDRDWDWSYMWWHDEQTKKPDVYVRVHFNLEGTWSPVLDSEIRWNTLEPTWEREVVSVEPGQKVLLEVWDCDTYVKNTLIGSKEYTLPNQSETVELSFGDVEKLVFEYTVPASYSEVQALQGEEREELWKKYVSREHITSAGTKYLMLEGAVVAENETWGLGKHIKARRPDLLVDIFMQQGDEWQLAFRSKVCPNSFAPIWKQPTPVPVVEGQQFLITVWDKDFGGLDYFGEAAYTIRDAGLSEYIVEGFDFMKNVKFTPWNVWDKLPEHPHPSKGFLSDLKIPELKLKLVNPMKAWELSVTAAFDSFNQNDKELRAQLQEKLLGWKKVLSDEEHTRLLRLFNDEIRSGAFGKLIWDALARANVPQGKATLLGYLDAYDTVLRALQTAHIFPPHRACVDLRAYNGDKIFSVTAENLEDLSAWKKFIKYSVKGDYVSLYFYAHYMNDKKIKRPNHYDWDWVKVVLNQIEDQGFESSADWGLISNRKGMLLTSGQAKFIVKTSTSLALDALQQRIYWQVWWSKAAFETYYKSEDWLKTVPDRDSMLKVVEALGADLEAIWSGQGLRTWNDYYKTKSGLGRAWHTDPGFRARAGMWLTGLGDVYKELERDQIYWPD